MPSSPTSRRIWRCSAVSVFIAAVNSCAGAPLGGGGHADQRSSATSVISSSIPRLRLRRKLVNIEVVQDRAEPTAQPLRIAQAVGLPERPLQTVLHKVVAGGEAARQRQRVPAQGRQLLDKSARELRTRIGPQHSPHNTALPACRPRVFRGAIRLRGGLVKLRRKAARVIPRLGPGPRSRRGL